uniref:Restriction endonuclease n=1 Tax=Pithovirus LCPAC201 TaxID=2506591 RepID=A0A481Z5B9_9VIRU|nr:MAG: restriction endonuclease [Pithovirus LCPAC201]
MSWYDWVSQSPTDYVPLLRNFTSWITWLIIAIIIIIIFWIVWGGGNHNFIGYKPLVPGIKPSDVMDQDTMIILGITDPVTPRTDGEASVRGGSISVDFPRTETLPSVQEDLTAVYFPRTDSEDSSPLNESSPSSSDDEENFIDLSQLVPGTGSLTPFNENTTHPVRMVSSRQIRENQLNSDVTIYLSSPDKPPMGKTPKFEDLNLGTAQERRSAAESRGERVCREFLEKYYQRKFPRIRPDFLVNPVSGRNLELDGYNSELNIGFEYNGYQHYTYPNRFHKNEEDFSQQIRRDGYKKEACHLAGVYLIIIPYTVPHAHIPQFIKGRLPHKIHLLNPSQR